VATSSEASAPIVGVVAETSPGERRVALAPDSVTRLRRAGFEVVIEPGAGTAASFADDQYEQTGARLAPRREVIDQAAAIAVVNPPDAALVEALRPGQWIAGLLQARTDTDLVAALEAKHVTAAALDLLPRTLSSAQSMDALTSQANVAGYKAVLVAASAFGRYLPMLMTAAGTVRPAQVLVMGAGVAGLQAIGTAHRLGAVVTGYDVRSAAREQVESLGASFLELDAPTADGAGGYARQLTPEEQAQQQAALAAALVEFDIVITTAQVPGRRPPLLVTEDTLQRMRRGSVLVDLGASDLGGNVAGSRPGDMITTANGVIVIGAGSLPSSMPTSASSAYGRNVGDFLTHFLRDGELRVDAADPIDAAVIVAGKPPAPTPEAATEEAS
jgi:NAD(P) transhydrogenase subunit alpha